MFVGESNDPGCSESSRLLELVGRLAISQFETPTILREISNSGISSCCQNYDRTSKLPFRKSP
jgi:hypothetical protein